MCRVRCFWLRQLGVDHVTPDVRELPEFSRTQGNSGLSMFRQRENASANEKETTEHVLQQPIHIWPSRRQGTQPRWLCTPSGGQWIASPLTNSSPHNTTCKCHCQFWSAEKHFKVFAEDLANVSQYTTWGGGKAQLSKMRFCSL